MPNDVIEFRLREAERWSFAALYLIGAFLSLAAISAPITLGLWKELVLVTVLGGIAGACFATAAFFRMWFWPPEYALVTGQAGDILLRHGQKSLRLADYSAMGLGDRKGRKLVLVCNGHGMRFWNLREVDGGRRLWDHLLATADTHGMFDCSHYEREKEPFLRAVLACPWRWLSTIMAGLFVFAMLFGGGMFILFVEMQRGWDDPRFIAGAALAVILSFLWLAIGRLLKCAAHIEGDRLVVTGYLSARSYPLEAIVELRSQRQATAVFFGDGRRVVFPEGWRAPVWRELSEVLRDYG